MNDGAQREHDSKRLRFAAVFLISGVALMLWAWGILTWRTRVAHRGSETVGFVAESTSDETADAIRAFPAVLLFSVLLFLAFLLD